MNRLVGAGLKRNPGDNLVDTNNQGSKPNIDRFVVIQVATTCDEHGIFVVRFVFQPSSTLRQRETVAFSGASRGSKPNIDHYVVVHVALLATSKYLRGCVSSSLEALPVILPQGHSRRGWATNVVS